MGKWTKANPTNVSQQFLQNQQRRKQMILQAAKRRKQKQRKLQQQLQQQKNQKQQAIIKHKQQKQDAYVKYLRNNMHDKYQQMKYNQKINQQQIKKGNKWKKNTQTQNNNKITQKNSNNNNMEWQKDQQQVVERKNQGYSMMKNNNINSTRANSANNNNQLQGLNLQVNINKHDKNNKASPFPKNNQSSTKNTNNKIYNASSSSAKNPNNNNKRRMLQDQFEKQWNQQHINNKKSKKLKQQHDLQLQCSLYDQDDLIGSKLLDSLDLDFQTVSRGRQYNKKLKQSFLELSQQPEDFKNKQVNQIKNMIGYQSVLMSIDQRSQILKKYNQLMVNQIEVKEKAFGMKKDKKQPILNNNDKSKDKNTKKSNNNDKKLSIQKAKNNKPLNEKELFNQLKNNKQGKILNWAHQQAQQAQDLFSNCSTNKKTNKSKGAELLKQINKQIQQKKSHSQTSIPSSQQINMKKKEAPLETIIQKRINQSKERIRERSHDKNKILINNQPAKTQTRFNAGNNNNKSTQKQIKNASQQRKISSTLIPLPTRTNRINPTQNNNQTQSNQPTRKIVLRQSSKQKINQTTTNSFKQNSNSFSTSENKIKANSHRSLSKQKQNNKSVKQIVPPDSNGYGKNQQNTSKQSNKTSNWQPQKGKTNSTISLNHLPPMPINARFNSQNFNNVDQITIATQDQVFQIQSFIKNQLVTLNKQQRQVQQQLKNIHIANKQKLKQIKQKYQIKTDYKHSKQLIQGYVPNNEDQDSNNSYRKMHQKQTEDQLQESIQRLDNMLLRKQVKNGKNGIIVQQDNQSQSTSRSIINPMTDPITLHKQVLQLAENLSRFQGEPENIEVGYGAKLRMMKKNQSKQKNTQKINQFSKQKKSNGTYSNNKKQYNQIGLSQSQNVNYSQLNSNVNTKHSKVSKVSKPPQLDYFQNNNNISPEVELSDLLDDQFEDSIEKGKIQVNQRLRKMLLQ